MSVFRIGVIALFALLFVGVAIAQEAPGNDFVEAEISNLRPYLGEQIIYTLRLYSKVQRAEQPSTVLPDFAGFWKQEIEPILQYPVLINDQSYTVTERRIALFPTYPQSLAIGETAVVIRDNLSNFGDVLLTVPMSIEVQRLPAPDDMTGFSGAVGQFEMLPTLDRQETRLGEPITLSVIVRGSGNVEQLPAPDLPDTDVWRILASSSTYGSFEFEGTLIGEKTYEWLLTPILIGEQAIPEIILQYFDPVNQAYQTINTLPIAVNVLPSDESTTRILVTLPTPERLPLQPIPATFRIGVSGPGLGFIVLWVMPPLAAIVTWWEMRRRWRIQQDLQAYQRSKALKHALAVLKRGDNSTVRTVHEAMLTYFADKMNAMPSTLKYEDIEATLAEHTLNPELVSKTTGILTLIDEAMYAPGDHVESARLSQQAATLLSEIDHQWR